MVAEKDNFELCKEIARENKQIQQVILDVGNQTISIEQLYQKSKNMSKEVGDDILYDLKGDDRKLALIHFSSGTTGKPKPAMRLHYNMNSISSLNVVKHAWFPTSSEDVLGCYGPYQHGGGLSMVVFALDVGATAVAIPGIVNIPEFCRIIEKYRVGWRAQLYLNSLLIQRRLRHSWEYRRC